MSQPPGTGPRIDVRGAVDLSNLGRPAAPAPGGEGQPASGAVVDVTEATFADVVQQSLEVPVVLSLWAARDAASSQVTALLVRVVGELGGRVLLGRVDVERSPQVAQAISAQAGSTVVAVVRGQAVPLPPLDQATIEQVRAVLDQVLEMAVANGVTGTVAGVSPGAPAEEPEEPPLPPLHQEAYEAIDRGDLDAAVDAYRRALTENPRDDMARAGLAQVELLRRTDGVDAAAARSAAAAAPTDVEAQLVVADLDLLAGAVEDAFARLVDTVRATAGADRETARVRLVELFAVVGDTDPRVMAARRALASALY
ncbi:tetratricopeptide repeat protein [Cellulomonas carbonis]|uniref:Thioredoxin n=1 Tax=Cellulomonas carbonis T26 TaxID=947969 RepID=A0A0A0BPT8_9CELL|nr:tetratricopeptide repeat protein [Cellulomonas carbonis]KGM09975.1 thioredoxin [Cellulomonas carbonis T26]GGC12225.1 co-chaperone YbbN [Cellulomonas carbonis]